MSVLSGIAGLQNSSTFVFWDTTILVSKAVMQVYSCKILRNWNWVLELEDIGIQVRVNILYYLYQTSTIAQFASMLYILIHATFYKRRAHICILGT